MSGGITATTVAAYAAAASAVIGIGSALQQGAQAKAMGNYQREQAQVDADVAASEAQVQARAIRQAGDKQRATARAQLAAAGVTTGEGTAELIDKDINANAEQDALNVIYQGGNQAAQIRAAGQAAGIRGSNAQTAGYFNAASTALGSASTAYRGWGSSSGDGLSQGDRRKIGVY